MGLIKEGGGERDLLLYEEIIREGIYQRKGLLGRG